MVSHIVRTCKELLQELTKTVLSSGACRNIEGNEIEDELTRRGQNFNRLLRSVKSPMSAVKKFSSQNLLEYHDY